MTMRIAFALAALALCAEAQAQQFQFQQGTRTDYMRTCRMEHQDEAGPQSAGTRQTCERFWVQWQSAGPMAAAILNGAAASPSRALTLADAQARLSGVRWDATPRENGLAASGQVGEFIATLTQRNPDRAMFIWQGERTDAYYELERAFVAAGATIEEVGCSYLAGRNNGQETGAQFYKGFRITAPGRAPFGVVVAWLDDPYVYPHPITTSQLIVADLTGQTPTRARLSALTPNARWVGCETMAE